MTQTTADYLVCPNPDCGLPNDPGSFVCGFCQHDLFAGGAALANGSPVPDDRTAARAAVTPVALTAAASETPSRRPASAPEMSTGSVVVVGADHLFDEEAEAPAQHSGAPRGSGAVERPLSGMSASGVASATPPGQTTSLFALAKKVEPPVDGGAYLVVMLDKSPRGSRPAHMTPPPEMEPIVFPLTAGRLYSFGRLAGQNDFAIEFDRGIGSVWHGTFSQMPSGGWGVTLQHQKNTLKLNGAYCARGGRKEAPHCSEIKGGLWTTMYLFERPPSEADQLVEQE
jgi:hypothetical protein